MDEYERFSTFFSARFAREDGDSDPPSEPPVDDAAPSRVEILLPPASVKSRR
jgi:hypothetical protein